MFRKMRRSKQQLTQEECIQVLKTQKRGFIAVQGDNDYPYNLPINYVYHDNKIILHSAMEGHFPESIRKHEKVSFAVIDAGTKVENEWYKIFKSIIIFGKIKIITSDEEKNKYFKILGDKYYPSHDYTLNVMKNSAKNAQILLLDIEYMTGKEVKEK